MLNVIMLIVVILYVIMLNHYAECHYAGCHYAECHYAECHYAECHYAKCRVTLSYRTAKLITAIKNLLCCIQNVSFLSFDRKLKECSQQHYFYLPIFDKT